MSDNQTPATPPDAPDDAPNSPIERLIQAGEGLTDALHKLDRTTGTTVVSLAERDIRTRRLVRGLLTAGLIEILIIALISLGVVSIRENQESINALTTRLNIAQTVTRQQSLCPLYQLLLDSVSNPAARAQAPNKTAFDHAVTVIKNGYTALHCADFAKQPATTPTPAAK